MKKRKMPNRKERKGAEAKIESQREKKKEGQSSKGQNTTEIIDICSLNKHRILYRKAKQYLYVIL